MRKAISRARRAHAAALQRWEATAHADDDDLGDLPAMARDALAHLDAGRWDDAIALSEEISAAASAGASAAVWTPFSLEVGEAAEVGRSVG